MKNNELANTESIILAIKDELTETFMQPVFLKGKKWKEEAQRLFEYNINNIGLWKSNPSNFNMYVIGVFNEESGLITPGIQSMLFTGTSLVRKE